MTPGTISYGLRGGGTMGSNGAPTGSRAASGLGSTTLPLVGWHVPVLLLIGAISFVWFHYYE